MSGVCEPRREGRPGPGLVMVAVQLPVGLRGGGGAPGPRPASRCGPPSPSRDVASLAARRRRGLGPLRTSAAAGAFCLHYLRVRRCPGSSLPGRSPVTPSAPAG